MFSLLFFALCTKATAQLLGCDEIEGCPTNGNNPGTSCRLQNETMAAIGVAQLTTSMSTDPLSWTVTETISAGEKTLMLYHKGFYLGEPPDLRLSELTSTKGCAIFFEGIAQALQYHWDREAIGTCEDALTDLCVRDLTAQAKALVDKSAGSLDCNELAASLQSQPPATCPYWYGNWGLVTAHTIAGQGSPEPLQLENCNPTPGKNYALSHVQSFNGSVKPDSEAGMLNFAFGITPVMTVFAPISPNGTADSTEPILTSSEAHLTCLRVKPANVTGQFSAGHRSTDNMLLNPFTALALGLFVLLSNFV